MRKQVYTVRDSKGAMFMTPFNFNTHGEAERALREYTKNPESLISKYPEDYDLFHLGEWDDQSGKYQLLDAPQHIINAKVLSTASVTGA